MLFGRSQEQMIALLIALIPAFTFHEFAHAWVAYRLGDPTAKNMGRLTLNPTQAPRGVWDSDGAFRGLWLGQTGDG